MNNNPTGSTSSISPSLYLREDTEADYEADYVTRVALEAGITPRQWLYRASAAMADIDRARKLNREAQQRTRDRRKAAQEAQAQEAETRRAARFAAWLEAARAESQDRSGDTA